MAGVVGAMLVPWAFSKQIVRTLNQMPGHLRQVFTLTHYEERTREDIANKMGSGKSGDSDSG